MIAVEPAIVIPVVAVAGVAALVVVFGLVRSATRRARARAEAMLPANSRRRAVVWSLGQASRGHGQIRGNGTLALTADALVFVLWVPRRQVVIPLSRIVAVDTTKSHLGKRVGAHLLRVRWLSDEGEDVIAWQLADLESWLAALTPSPRPGS